jgi:hypothetical protein
MSTSDLTSFNSPIAPPKAPSNSVKSGALLPTRDFHALGHELLMNGMHEQLKRMQATEPVSANSSSLG